jgi:CRISPR-associated protein Cas1
MNPLYLSGFGVSLRRSQGELTITDERSDKAFRFKPRRCPYTSIVIDGHSGYVTLQALHWLSRNNVPLFLVHYDGSILSSILPPTITRARLRRAQFKAAENSKIRFRIAKEIVGAKVASSILLLELFGQRSDIVRETQQAKRQAEKLTAAHTITRLREVEAKVSQRYWSAYKACLPSELAFETRSVKSRPNKASDPVNLALNYSYGFLECECRKAINTVGLEPSVGFLHEYSDYQTKQSLVYDLQELYRWLCDWVTMSAFQSGTLNGESFHFEEHSAGYPYKLCFEENAKNRFVRALRERFGTHVEYKGKRVTWYTLIEQKTAELARFLVQVKP